MSRSGGPNARQQAPQQRMAYGKKFHLCDHLTLIVLFLNEVIFDRKKCVEII